VIGVNKGPLGGEYFENIRLPNTTVNTLIDWYLGNDEIIADINRTDLTSKKISGILYYDGADILNYLFADVPCGVVGTGALTAYRRADGGGSIWIQDNHYTFCDRGIGVYISVEVGR
jgi:hypothetical protein